MFTLFPESAADSAAAPGGLLNHFDTYVQCNNTRVLYVKVKIVE